MKHRQEVKVNRSDPLSRRQEDVLWIKGSDQREKLKPSI